jgi:hypothetical protein
VIVGQPLGGELPRGSTQPLAELSAHVVASRVAVAVRSRPDYVDPRTRSCPAVLMLSEVLIFILCR